MTKQHLQKKLPRANFRQTGSNETLKRETVFISMSDLYMPGYQRKTQKWRVNKIAKEFKADMMDDLIISYREGKYWVVDGGHRFEAISIINEQRMRESKAPFDTIPCRILYGYDYQDEAEYYRGLNKNRRIPGRLEDHEAAVEAGDEEAVAIKRLLEKYGLSFGNCKNSTTITAVKSVYDLVTFYGFDVMDYMFKTHKELWFGVKDMLDAHVLGGLSELIFRHGYRDEYKWRLSQARINLKLLKDTYEARYRAARETRKDAGPRNRAIFCGLLEELYNKHLPQDSKKRLWEGSVYGSHNDRHEQDRHR